MKKYIAPELQVELYTLDASIAAGCAIVDSNTATDASCVQGGNAAAFQVGGKVSLGASSDGNGGSLENYSTPNFGNPGVSQQSGSCDCYYSAYGISLLATS